MSCTKSQKEPPATSLLEIETNTMQTRDLAIMFKNDLS